MHVHSFFVTVLALGSARVTNARLTNNGLNHEEEARAIEASRDFCTKEMNKKQTTTYFPQLLNQLWSQLDAMDRVVDTIDQAVVSRNPVGVLQLADLGDPRQRMCGMLELKKSIGSLEQEITKSKKIPSGYACTGNSGLDLHYHLGKLAVDAKIGVDNDLFDLTFYEILRLQQPKLQEFAIKAASKAVRKPAGQQSPELDLSPEGLKKQVDSFIQKQHPDFDGEPGKTQRYDGMAKFAANVVSGSQALLMGLDLSPLEPLCGPTLKPLDAKELNNIVLNRDNLKKVGEYIKTIGGMPELQSISVLADVIGPIAQNIGFSQDQVQQAEDALTKMTKGGKIAVKELAQGLGNAIQARADPEDPVRQLIQRGLGFAAGMMSGTNFAILKSMGKLF